MTDTGTASRRAGRRRLRQVLPRLSILVGIVALVAWYAYARLTPALDLGTDWQPVWRTTLVFAVIGMPVGMLAPLIRRPGLQQLVAWPGLLLMGWFSTLVILTLVRDLALGLLAFWPLVQAQFGRPSAIAVLALSLCASLLGLYNARRVPALRHLDFASDRIGPALDGLRIIQLSDIHIGPTIGAGHIRKIVEACNREAPDLVVITGDVVDGSPGRLEPGVAELGRLQTRHGVYMVPGNHDYYSGLQRWLPVYVRHGIDVLLNAHRAIRVGTETLYVAGVTDHSAHHFVASQRSDAEAALRGVPADAPVLMLAHQPVQGRDMPGERILLQLSGHTHGGQFFPWGWAVPLQQPITAGLSRRLGHPVYVSRGTGYWGPPKRLFSPAEITVITLRAAAQA